MTNVTLTAQSDSDVVPAPSSVFDFLKNQNTELISIIKKTNEELLKLLKPPSPPSPPPPPTKYSFESTDGVQLSEKNSPWKTAFSEPCYVCRYFGHGHKQCPNILEQFRGSCLKCCGAGHVAEDCVNNAREPPMRSGFKKPTYFCS
jgi:hypothetical protein